MHFSIVACLNRACAGAGARPLALGMLQGFDRSTDARKAPAGHAGSSAAPLWGSVSRALGLWLAERSAEGVQQQSKLPPVVRLRLWSRSEDRARNLEIRGLTFGR